MPAFRELRRLPEFERDLKGLRRRFRTLEEDLLTLIGAELMLFHKLKVDNKGIFRITGMPFDDPEIYKVKKFACRALKGRGANTGLRLIYAYFRTEDRIDMVELYFKADKENEDRDRLLGNYAKGSKKGE
jgi:hypothetical protein